MLPGTRQRLDIAWYDDSTQPRWWPERFRRGRPPGRLLRVVEQRGASFGANHRITDRSIDRSVGVWSNNVGSAAPVGIISDDDVVSFAWHDTRAGDGATAASMSAFSCSYRSTHSARVDDLDDALLTPPDQNIVVIVVFSSPGLFLAHGASGGRWITVSAPE
ncbi:MAG: hypothetical protein M3P53_05405 [Actinomycetota bacterium]|nr:hypothetical protein [Actinomycetota bacterium]